jgi:metal-responsive CopG/Arc/MetJ family transcriptional regulator
MTEVVSFKLPRDLLVRVDGLTSNRSDFIRQAIEEKVQRANRRKGQSVWDALEGISSLEIRIPLTPGKVRRIDL